MGGIDYYELNQAMNDSKNYIDKTKRDLQDEIANLSRRISVLEANVSTLSAAVAGIDKTVRAVASYHV